MTGRSRVSVVMALVMIGLGLALLGVAFVAAGAGRLYLERRRS
jgi:hypothetical protein